MNKLDIVNALYALAAKSERVDAKVLTGSLRDLAAEVAALKLEAPAARESGAAWFGALQGGVQGYEVRKYGDIVDFRDPQNPEAEKLVVDRMSRAGYCVLPAPAWAKEKDLVWVAATDRVHNIGGIGRTPAEAIADFNRQMVEP
jgi:hypothetical protein